MTRKKPRAYTSRSTWFDCPKCGLEVRAIKPKLCRACADKLRRKRNKK